MSHLTLSRQPSAEGTGPRSVQLGTPELISPIILNNTLSPYTIPATAADGCSWTLTDQRVAQMAAWRATYTVYRLPSTIIAANGINNYNFNLPNNDPYTVVVYGSASGRASVLDSRGATVLAAFAGSTNGVVAPTNFSGAGAYTLRITNTSASRITVFAAVFSRSRFESDFYTATRGDMIQMYMDAGSLDKPSPSQHTTFVQTAQNRGANNWVDSNWCALSCQIVSQHTVGVGDMMRWTLKNPAYGFTVYRLQ